MGFVVLKCSNCGANLEVNDDKKSGFCPYCGAQYVQEEVTNITNIANTEINNITYGAKSSDTDYAERIVAFIKVEEYKNAQKLVEEFKTEHSQLGIPYVVSAFFCTSCKPNDKGDYKSFNYKTEETNAIKINQQVKDIAQKLNLEQLTKEQAIVIRNELQAIKVPKNDFIQGEHNCFSEWKKAQKLISDSDTKKFETFISTTKTRVETLDKVSALNKETKELYDSLLSKVNNFIAGINQQEADAIARARQAEAEEKARAEQEAKEAEIQLKREEYQKKKAEKEAAEKYEAKRKKVIKGFWITAVIGFFVVAVATLFPIEQYYIKLGWDSAMARSMAIDIAAYVEYAYIAIATVVGVILAIVFKKKKK